MLVNSGLRTSTTFILCCAALTFGLTSGAQQAVQGEHAPPKIVVNVNRLLVPVVVRDAQGRAVVDLKKEDFQVFDEGKPQAISGFIVERGAGTGNKTGNNAESGKQPAPASKASSPSEAVPQRIVVLLFDDLHLAIEDLLRAKAGASKVLSSVVSDSDMGAVVSTSGKINSGLTRDRGKLQNAINSLKSRGAQRAGANDCPTIDYYEADLILNKHDLSALREGMAQMARCDPKIIPTLAQSMVESTARRVVATGEQDVQATNFAIGEYVRRMANLPGRRTLIVVSSGYLSLQPEAQNAESRIIDLATRANVTINALDARGLYTTAITASDNLAGRPIGLMADYRSSSLKLAEAPMSELADGTGGSFFHNSNDLDAGFKGLTEVPECIYVLALPLDNGKADGRYHRLEVKVDRAGSVVQARRGYFFAAGKK